MHRQYSYIVYCMINGDAEVAGPAGMPAQVMLDSWGVDKAERQKYLCMPNDPRLEHC
jgi:hypothetical protein